MKFGTRYTRRKIVSPSGGKSLTEQQYKKECDINYILNNKAPQLFDDKKIPLYADVSMFGDFNDCMKKVQDGLDKFGNLPSTLRSRFGSDPRAFYNWLADESNSAEAVRLGLLEKKPDEKNVVEILDDIKTIVSSKSEESKSSSASST